jgi:hypothetical protein
VFQHGCMAAEKLRLRGEREQRLTGGACGPEQPIFRGASQSAGAEGRHQAPLGGWRRCRRPPNQDHACRAPEIWEPWLSVALVSASQLTPRFSKIVGRHQLVHWMSRCSWTLHQTTTKHDSGMLNATTPPASSVSLSNIDFAPRPRRIFPHTFVSHSACETQPGSAAPSALLQPILGHPRLDLTQGCGRVGDLRHK